MKIPRIWARICIVCIWIVGLAIVLRLFMNNQMPIFIGIAAFIVAIIIKYTVIRCLNCGLRGGIPQWRKNKTIHCPKCGHPFEYAD